MRYLFESIENERDIGLQISRWEKEGKIHMIEKGDKFEKIQEDLIKIKQALERLQKVGIDKEIMEAYIYKKSNVNMGDMKDVLYHQKDFLKKLRIL